MRLQQWQATRDWADWQRGGPANGGADHSPNNTASGDWRMAEILGLQSPGGLGWCDFGGGGTDSLSAGSKSDPRATDPARVLLVSLAFDAGSCICG
jgi:hypothetical protein